MRNLAPFSIGSIIKKLNRIHVCINSKHDRPFSKPAILWLSEYTYQRRYIKIHPDGRIAGGLSRFVSSLIDFSFIRSIVADEYRKIGFAYDPVSLFLLALFCCLEKYPNMKAFVEIIRDREKGKHYRLYAGITYPNIPCEATFTNFKERLGEDLYNRIFHALVEIVELLGFISYKIIATDGTLFPTNARYKGCTCFCKECKSVKFTGLIENVRQKIRYRLNNPERIVPGKEIRIRQECPSPTFPKDVTRPKVEFLVLSLEYADTENPSPFNQIFGLKEELQKAGLDLVVKRGIITEVDLTHDRDSFFFRCPRLPSDMEAKIGVRRDTQNPNRKVKIFGFNAVIDTSVEKTLGIELPVACTTIAGNAQEGKHYITNRKQTLEYHGKKSRIDLGDAKYDEHQNYAFSRSNGAIPIIDYNPRNEKLTTSALRERGYDQNGWPYAPCGILTRPNGFDFNSQRANFNCRRQCILSKDQKIVDYAKNCPCFISYNGFSKHVSTRQFPRLILEVIRGTYRYRKLKTLRSASERTNATAKDDFCILAKPKIRGLKNAGILSQMAVIIVLLKRISSFIVKITLAFRHKIEENKSPPNRIFIPGPAVPKFILNLVLRE